MRLSYNENMPISLDEVQHVARLARLELDEDELVAFQDELNALIGHFQDLNQLESLGVNMLPQNPGLNNVWSEDAVRAGLSRDAALKNAPVTRAGLFVVPTIIED